MNKPIFRLGDDTQIRLASRQIEMFLDAVFEAEDHHYFISDEASLYDIFVGDERDLVTRIKGNMMLISPKSTS